MKLLLLTILGVIISTQADSQVLKDFAVGSNKFSADVYKQLLKTNSGNFLVCPLSAETVLALVHGGAGGQTAQQIAAALHLPESKEKIQEMIKELTPHLQGNENYTLSSANKVYVNNGLQIKDEFKKIAVNVFEADIQNIDFEKNQQAAGEINKWVEEKTHDKIKNLINPESLSNETRSILINAMYFHGTWKSPFNKKSTAKRYFYVNNYQRIKTDMMEQTKFFKYFESSDLKAQFLELPYVGEDITMTFVLPKEMGGLTALEERIEDVFATPRSYSQVHVVVPRFKIESSIQFKPILQALGVTDAFGNADFNGILVDEPLKISEVVQKAFIEVEEEGTTAAAATYGTVDSYPEQFIAVHPFIFFIKIKDVVFFAGRYSSPN